MNDSIPNPKSILTVKTSHPITRAKFAPKSQHFLIAQDTYFTLYSSSTGSLIKTYPKLHNTSILDFQISNDSSKIISCSTSKAIVLWDVLKGQTICKFYGHFGDINAVSFAAQEQVIVSAGYDGSVKFWDLKQKLNMHRINLSESNNDSGNNTNPQQDKRNDYSGLIADYNSYSDTVTSLIVKDHNVFAGCLDGTILNIDIRQGLITKDKIYPSEGKEQAKCGVVSIDLLKDNKTLLVSLQNDEIKLYNSVQGNVLNSYYGHQIPADTIVGGYIDVKSSKDNSFFISGSADGNLYLWNMLDQRHQRKIPAALTGAVCNSVDVHHGTGQILSAGTDGVVKIWDVKN